MKLFDVDVAQGKRHQDIQVTNGTLDQNAFKVENFRIIPEATKEHKNGPYYCMASIDGKRTNENVKSIPLLAFDLDDQPFEAVKHTIGLLKDADMEYLLYTTASHNPDEIDPDTKKPKHKYRLLLPLETPITLAQFDGVYRYVEKAYKITADRNAVKPSQPFYMPTVVESLKHHAKVVGREGKAVAIDPTLLAELERKPESAKTASVMQFIMPNPPTVNSANLIQAVYDNIKVSTQDRDQWLEVCRAIKHQTQGKGFDGLDEWSVQDKRAGMYDKTEVKDNWDDVKPARPGKPLTTLNSLLNRKISAGITLRSKVMEMLLERSETDDNLEKLRKYIVEETNPTLEELAGPLAIGFRKAKKALHGVELTQAQAAHELRNGAKTDTGRAFFRDRFYYLNGTQKGKYYEIATGRTYTKEDFNNMYSTSHTECDSKGNYKDIERVLKNSKNYEPLIVCEGFKYRPQIKEILLEERDGNYINNFNHDTWPKPKTPFDPLEDAIDSEIELTVNTAFKVLGNCEIGMAEHLKQYIGHLRQHPGTRIMHAFAVTSKSGGIGKSMLKRMYEKVIGKDNIETIGRSALDSNFNEYREWPKLMIFCDELDDMKGGISTKAESLVAKLKEPITERGGSLNKKHLGSESCEYYASYAVFSNNERILGHQSQDRRWAHSNVDTVKVRRGTKLPDASLDNILGEKASVFFDRYDYLLSNHGDRFAAYFDSITLEGFNINKAFKSESVVVETTSYDHYITLTLDEQVALSSVMGDDDDNPRTIKEDIVQLATLVEMAKAEWHTEYPEDTKFNAMAFKRAVEDVLSESGYNPMGAGRMKKMGHPNPIRARAYWFKAPEALIEKGVDLKAIESDIRKKYN